MSSKHFWPEPPPPKDHSWTYLVEHREGEIRLMHLRRDGQWFVTGSPMGVTTDYLNQSGYVGVRTPFSEEDERVEFEKSFYGCDFTRDESGLYRHKTVQGFFVAWIAAKRHERGIK